MTAPVDGRSVEEWRPVVGYEGHYEASNHGRIRSLKTYRRPAPVTILRASHASKYPEVCLYLHNQKRSRTVHSLVAAAWLGPCPDGQEVRHFDGNATNSAVDNLLHGTRSQNQQDSVRHGTHKEARKTHCPQGHPYDAENTSVHADGKRHCRTCNRDRCRARHQRLLAGLSG